MTRGRRGNGEGSISKRPNGTYEAKITTEGGKRKSIYGKTRKEVQEKLKIALREQQQGSLVTAPQQKLEQFLNTWLDSVLMPLRWERWHERGEHAIAGREFDERLTTLRESLVIAAEPTPAHHPGETALNDPPLGLRSKAFRKHCIPVHFLPFGHEQAAFGEGH